MVKGARSLGRRSGTRRLCYRISMNTTRNGSIQARKGRRNAIHGIKLSLLNYIELLIQYNQKMEVILISFGATCCCGGGGIIICCSGCAIGCCVGCTIGCLTGMAVIVSFCFGQARWLCPTPPQLPHVTCDLFFVLCWSAILWHRFVPVLGRPFVLTLIGLRREDCTKCWLLDTVK